MANRSKSIDDSVGTRIKQLRTSRNITQKELAEQLYKSESTVRMWELGKSEPDLAMLKTIAEFFSVSTDYLLDRNDQVSLENELKIALFGIGTEVTDEMWNMVVNYAKFVKTQNEQKNQKRKHNMSISINLKLAMFKEGLDTPKLAYDTQISEREIRKYLGAQKIPGAEEAKKIAKRLRISQEWFMCTDETISYWEGLRLEKKPVKKQLELVDFAKRIGIEIEPIRAAISDEELFEPLSEYRRIARSENYDSTEDTPPSQEHLEGIVEAEKNDTESTQ